MRDRAREHEEASRLEIRQSVGCMLDKREADIRAAVELSLLRLMEERARESDEAWKVSAHALANALRRLRPL